MLRTAYLVVGENAASADILVILATRTTTWTVTHRKESDCNTTRAIVFILRVLVGGQRTQAAS